MYVYVQACVAIHLPVLLCMMYVSMRASMCHHTFTRIAVHDVCIYVCVQACVTIRLPVYNGNGSPSFNKACLCKLEIIITLEIWVEKMAVDSRIEE